MLVETEGVASREGMRRINDAIVAHPERDDRRPIVVDHSRLDQRPLTVNVMPELADRTSTDYGPWRAPRAIVCPDSLGYGQARMWLANLTRERQEMAGVFRSREQAVAWIRSFKLS